MALFRAFGVEAGEVVAAGVVVVRSLVVAMCQIATSMCALDGDVGFMRATAGGDPAIFGGRGRCRGFWEHGHRRGAEGALEVGVARSGRLDLTLPADSLLPGVVPAHDARCCAVGNLAHVGAGLGDDDVGGVAPDPGDGADQVAEAVKGLDHQLDSIGELLDGRGVLVDQVQVHAGQKRVMGGEPP